MFLFRSAESLYGAGNVFILGLYASPVVTGNFAIAEKISRATFGLLNPIRDAMFPRLSFLAVSSEAAAARLAQLGSFVMVGLGCLLSGSLLVFAPQLIHLVAGGSEFVEAVTILRILSPLPIVLAVTYSVGLQWLLPLGRDATVNRLIMGGGAINLLLAFMLAPTHGGTGMAVSVLCAEASVACGMVAVVLRTTSFTFAMPRLREIRALISKPGERSSAESVHLAGAPVENLEVI
jgi:O-antigen/teichoic acid export membrane protein